MLKFLGVRIYTHGFQALVCVVQFCIKPRFRFTLVRTTSGSVQKKTIAFPLWALRFNIYWSTMFLKVFSTEQSFHIFPRVKSCFRTVWLNNVSTIGLGNASLTENSTHETSILLKWLQYKTANLMFFSPEWQRNIVSSRSLRHSKVRELKTSTSSSPRGFFLSVWQLILPHSTQHSDTVGFFVPSQR